MQQADSSIMAENHKPLLCNIIQTNLLAIISIKYYIVFKSSIWRIQLVDANKQAF